MQKGTASLGICSQARPWDPLLTPQESWASSPPFFQEVPLQEAKQSFSKRSEAPGSTGGAAGLLGEPLPRLQEQSSSV